MTSNASWLCRLTLVASLAAVATAFQARAAGTTATFSNGSPAAARHLHPSQSHTGRRKPPRPISRRGRERPVFVIPAVRH